MPNYHLKVVGRGRKEKFYPCESITVTPVPSKGYYAENPQVIGVPEGQRVKFDLEYVDEKGELSRKVILIPKDGIVAYILDAHNNGETIDTYPKKRDRQPVDQGREFGLKVGSQ